jgi:hypothetical protein
MGFRESFAHGVIVEARLPKLQISKRLQGVRIFPVFQEENS